MEQTFTDGNFEQEVIQSSVPVLVDFWAEWCGPCRTMGPMVEELAHEIDPAKLKVGKLNVDENPATAEKYSVMSIPTFLIIKNGKIVDQFVGGMARDSFRAKVMQHVK